MNKDTLTSCKVECLLNIHLTGNTGILAVLCTKASVPVAGGAFRYHNNQPLPQKV
jgi:hypothetical protein